MKLIGLDPGVASFGIAVATLGHRSERIDLVKVIHTTKAPKHEKRLVSTDMRERMQTIALELAALCDHDVIALCVEAGAVPFGQVRPHVITGLGRARGLVDMLAAVMGLPVIEPTPQALKKLATGSATASKQEVQSALELRFPELVAMRPRLKGDLEHAFDAVGAILFGLQSDVVQSRRSGFGVVSGGRR